MRQIEGEHKRYLYQIKTTTTMAPSEKNNYLKVIYRAAEATAIKTMTVVYRNPKFKNRYYVTTNYKI
ncbi:MAG: hypothetical protein ACI825_000047 [Planctomycetota bacterium]|jgi:hypothetical protein